MISDPELRSQALVSVQHESMRPDELGAVEVVLAVVSTAAAIGQLAIAVQEWRDQLRRSPQIRLVVADAHREKAKPVFDALRGAEPFESAPEPADASQAAGRIDPANSACVLIGVNSYSHRDLSPLPGVYNNIERLSKVLTDDNIWGIKPGRIQLVHNPKISTELVQPIREMSELATDTLIIYYSGHGLKDLPSNELYLALSDSAPGQRETAVRYQDVKEAIAQRQAKRVVVILDCCYGGAAIDGGMSAAVEDMRSDAGVDDIHGSYLMCSAAANRKALAEDPDGCTVFTGKLVSALGDGVPDRTETMLSLGMIFEVVRKQLKRANQPEPQEWDQNQIGKLPFAHNVAHRPTPTAAPAPPPPRRRLLSRLRIAVALVLAFGFGLAVQPGIDWWRERHPVSAGGPCSRNATLLSFSDDLDKKEVRGEQLSGLSALSLTGPSSGFALADNAPGRVFPLTIGDPNALSVSPAGGRTLRDTNGNPYLGGIDGEGMVLEPDTGTMLISSEEGPSIRRFRLSDGREIGQPLPIPPAMRTAPDGGAQYGRTVESLTATPDGEYLYAGWEAPLSADGDQRGRNRIRIQRYVGSTGGAYTPDVQYAYETGTGAYLSELVYVGPERLLALERQYVEGLGNSIRVYEVNLAGARDVTDNPSLSDDTADTFLPTTLLFDLANCPAGSRGQVDVKEKQPNPLLGNAEGLAVGPATAADAHRGTRLLFLLTDDNDNGAQITRLYAFRVRLPTATRG